MKINRTELLKKVEVAAKVCPTTTPMEILKWIKLAFDGQSLTITSTDCEVGMKLVIPGGIEGSACTVVVPSAQTVSILRELTSDQVDLEWDGGAHATIRGGRDTIKVRAWGEAGEFPEWRHEGIEYILKPGEFNAAVQRCVYAADKTNGRAVMQAVHLLIEGGNLTIQATDCAKAAFEPISCIGDPCKALIPVKAVSMMSAAVGKDFTLSISEESVEFRTPCDVVYSRQVNGRFPDFDSLKRDMDPKATPPITANVGELARFVRKAMLATDVEARGIDVVLEGNTLRATSSSQNKGETDVFMHVESSASCQVRVWADYMREMLSVLNPSDLLTWEMSPNRPNVFRLGSWTGILMPLAVEEVT